MDKEFHGLHFFPQRFSERIVRALLLIHPVLVDNNNLECAQDYPLFTIKELVKVVIFVKNKKASVQDRISTMV